jgi:hypothetical protein
MGKRRTLLVIPDGAFNKAPWDRAYTQNSKLLLLGLNKTIVVTGKNENLYNLGGSSNTYLGNRITNGAIWIPKEWQSSVRNEPCSCSWTHCRRRETVK